MRNPLLQLGALIWLLAMSGVVVATFSIVPQVASGITLKVPLGVLLAASIGQSALLVAVAVWAGLTLSRHLGLGAPALEAVVAGNSPLPILRRQLAPAFLTGLATGVFLLLMYSVAPNELASASQEFHIPLAAKILYGGITEEVLMRYGLMTILAWIGWRFLQKREGPIRRHYVIAAIVLAAVLFAAGHLPAAASMGASLNLATIAFILLGNTLPAVAFGILYWRWGLEAAIIAHALAHVVHVAIEAVISGAAI
jgi:membrane protease YdiL (CAAX protease family)